MKTNHNLPAPASSSPLPAGGTAETNTNTDVSDTLRPEYDGGVLRDPVRGKYAARMAEGVRIRIDGVRTVSLPADLDAAFPTDQELCNALRDWLLAHQDTPAASHELPAA